MENIAEIFKALGDTTRLNIIKMIVSKGNNLCVGAIANQLAISQPAVSQHLKILRNAGLVESDRIGFHVHYRFRDASLNAAGIDRVEFLKKMGIKKTGDNSCEHTGNEARCKKGN
ncbi:MAG: winged helix-turn-helix transcriptional regulator [Spirochaetales bacterium]|nr:winged helix-turn-helix transcriptional regulator [Spirochaetales bacterium]